MTVSYRATCRHVYLATHGGERERERESWEGVRGKKKKAVEAMSCKHVKFITGILSIKLVKVIKTYR